MTNRYNKHKGERSRLSSSKTARETTTLQDMKRHNKLVGGYFFDRENPPVVAKRGDYLVAGGVSDGFVVYKYDSNTGRINLMDNDYGEYSWQPHKTKSDAVGYVSYLNILSRNQRK